MAKAFPSDAQVNLLVADDVRQELNKKISLSGFYPANKLNVKDLGANIVIPLAFIVIVTGGEGTFKFKIDFLLPSGVILFQGPEVDLIKEPRLTAISLTKVIAFPLTVIGDYTINLYFDGKKYSRTLEVGHDPTLQAT